MKYYDGMGKDVTDYVVGLENRIQELELSAKAPKTEAKEQLIQKAEDVGIMEESPKPTRRRKIADTQ